MDNTGRPPHAVTNAVRQTRKMIAQNWYVQNDMKLDKGKFYQNKMDAFSNKIS